MVFSTVYDTMVFSTVYSSMVFLIVSHKFSLNGKSSECFRIRETTKQINGMRYYDLYRGRVNNIYI